jgi:metallo-beta-lactamase class B
MRYIKYIILLSFISILSCKTSQNALKPYETDTLKIVPLSDNTFIHITYLQTESFGKVACNGLVFKEKNEAYIFDTPTNDTVSLELINWVEKNLKCSVKGIVINHFHNDCLGGLKAFHQKKIPSFANNKTIELAKKQGFEVPQNGFEGRQELKAGTKTIVNQFYGEGHTRDNIVSYIPSEKVLFGGCLIKEVGASFGFLGDANVQEWSNTVSKIKANLPDVRYVVPGHGAAGGVALLDYTIEKFMEKAGK